MLAPIRFFPSKFLLAFILLGNTIVRADCLPIFYTQYVGNTAIDNQCTHNDIQSAINASNCPTTIYVSNERAWTSQHLDINNKNVTIVGRSGGCGQQACDGGGCIVPTTPEVIIDGAGHSGDSVMYIHGNSNVILKSLDIRNGYNINGSANTYGGGIHFDGKGSLALDTVWVRNNTARFGAGINFNGSGGFAGLTVLGNTQIFANTAANSGGGMRLSGDAFMSMLYDGTSVFYNHAPNGYGGGVNIVGPARADIASPGLGNVGVIYLNDAKYGGGIAVTASSGGEAKLQLFKTDSSKPVRVQGNFASTSGGGIYVAAYESFPSFLAARVCAFDFRVDDNAAPEGSAMEAVDGAGIFFNDLSFCTGIPTSARRCTQGMECNKIDGNVSIDSESNPTLGATIHLDNEGGLRATRFLMRDNVGGYAIRSSDNPLTISECLLVANDVSRQLLRTDSTGMYINNCTLASNVIHSTNSIYSEAFLHLSNSIIDQPGNNALGYAGNPSDLQVSYVLSSDVTTLPVTESVVSGQPTYVNSSLGDYHLTLHSLGVDFAEAITGDDRDLDNHPHDQDLSEVANLFGVRDLGAYERQRSCGANDTIFCNGFESP